jgi:hypothetical protein
MHAMGRPPRVFNLPLLHEELSRFDVALIEGVKLWPGENDEDQRRQAFERSVVEIWRPGFGALPETAIGDIFTLADGAHPLPAIQAAARKPSLHGAIAGNVLRNVLDLIACDPGNASLGKAIEMSLPDAAQLSSSTFNCTISSSTFNNTIWPKYRCVARSRQPAEQSGLRRVLSEQVAMQAPMPAALVGERETKAAFLRRVLLRIEALVDHDPGFVEENCAKDIGVTLGRNAK